MLLGENFFPLLILAFGAAAALGTIARMVQEKGAPTATLDPATKRAILARNLLMIAVGLTMSIVAIITIIVRN